MIPDLFAGPGGWDVAAARLGLARVVGIELDAAACATRAAAGHRTVRADVSAFPVERLAGRVTGLIGSPPCTTFSAAGKRASAGVMDVLDASIRDALEGSRTRAAHRREMALMLRKAWWPSAKLTRAERSARIWQAVRSASLVTEPARFIWAARPQWVALEQVPAVLPLWRAYADELTALGYSAWCGVLNSANYGVPQTRLRAILIASRTRRVACPEATHYDPRKGMQLFGEPWISMAQALGWGATGRPGPAVTAGGTATGGAEPFPTRARDLLAAERDADRWVVNPNASGHMRGYTRDVGQPSPGLTGQVQFWSLRRSRGSGLLDRGGPRRDHPLDEPAPTISGAGSASGSGNGTGLSWVTSRPATAVVGDARISRPGHSGARGDSQSTDAIRITVAEASALQSFPAGYPWQGTKTKQFEQVGNAWCPLAAIAVLGMAAGVEWRPVAEQYAKALYGRREVA